MHTGYTAEVVTGKLTDFRTFALQCARAFGACIMQRDDPMQELPRLREVGEYHAQRVAVCEDDLARLARMRAAEVAEACEAEYRRALDEYERSQRVARESRERIDNMLEAVRAWRPPTPEHVGLRDFMVQQLTETRRYDGEPWGKAPTLRTVAEFRREELRRRREALESARKYLHEETHWVRDANAWIVALYESLGLPGTGAVRSPENAPPREGDAAPVSPEPASICAADDEC